MSSLRRASRALLRCSLTALLVLVGCGDQPSSPQVDRILLAPGGGGGPSPKVDEADPPSAPQDTTLDVRILGSNFDDGSVAEFTIDGVATSKVRTNATQFVSSGELVANVTIDPDAALDFYDVEVTNTRGKKGIGADKFQVFEKGGGPRIDPPIMETFRDASTDNIRSDGRGPYEDGECGVSATFNLNDARLDPDAASIHPRDQGACGGRDERTITVAFTDRLDGSPPSGQDGNTVGAGFFIIEDVELVTEADGPTLTFGVLQGPFCNNGLNFNPDIDPQSDWLEVTKNADGTWTVTTQPPPNDVAVCVPDESQPSPPARSYYHMPLELNIRLK